MERRFFDPYSTSAGLETHQEFHSPMTQVNNKIRPNINAIIRWREELVPDP